MKEDTIKTKNVILMVGFLFIAFFIFFLLINALSDNIQIDGNEQNLVEENYYLKILLKAQSELSDGYVIADEGIELYLLSQYAYEDLDFVNSERYCFQARTKFLITSQTFREIKASLKEDKEYELIKLYSDMIEEQIIMYDNLYEACEHFESASRYFDKYYNAGVSYNDASYDMGSQEIEMANEKIEAHDNAVKRHNDILAEYTLELEKMLEI